MNDVISNGTKVAGTIVDSLKSQPLLLALLVFNIAFFVLFYFVSNDTRARQSEMVAHLLTNQGKMQEMMAHCAGAQRQ